MRMRSALWGQTQIKPFHVKTTFAFAMRIFSPPATSCVLLQRHWRDFSPQYGSRISSNLHLSRECKTEKIARKMNKAVCSVLNEESNKYRYSVKLSIHTVGFFGCGWRRDFTEESISFKKVLQQHEYPLPIHPMIRRENSNYFRNPLFIASLLGVWLHVVWQFIFSLWTALLLPAWQQALLPLSTAIKSLTCVSCAVLLLGDKAGVSQLWALVFQAALSRAFCCDEASQMTGKTYSRVKYPCWWETSEGKWKGF